MAFGWGFGFNLWEQLRVKAIPVTNLSIVRAALGTNVPSFGYFPNVFTFGNTDGTGKYYFGASFDSVTVPQGTTILSATLDFTILLVTGTDDVDTDIHAEKSTSSALVSAANLPESWVSTTATYDFQNTEGTGVKSLDVKAIVQEIVNQGAWASGGRINIAFIAGGADTLNRRYSGLNAGPTLNISY